MGLENNSKAKFISIIGGKFVTRTSKETPGAVSRINKKNVEVWELNYDHFSGFIKGIKVVDSEYGKQWNVILTDGEDEYVWTSPYANSFSKAFLKMLPNIDLTKAVKLSPSVKVVEGKNQSSLFINQDGNSIKHAYNKENPNGLPPMEKKKVKGNDVWDDTEQMEFLEQMVNDTIVPKLPIQNTAPKTHQWETEINAVEDEGAALSDEDF